MPRTMGVFVQSALLSLLIVGCHCQNIRVSVHGQDQSLSEATDCGPEARPDPRWTVRGTVDGGATSADWIIARDNIPGAGYQGITEDNLINAQSVPRSAVLFVQLDAFEFDPPDCKAFFSNNPLDGSCNGFGNGLTTGITSAPACTNNTVEIIRDCTSDLTTIRWSAVLRYTYEYEYGGILSCSATPPTPSPSLAPSLTPSLTPSKTPSHSPTSSPSRTPSSFPTSSPSLSPTSSPSKTPTQFPTTTPSQAPSTSPTTTPSFNPTANVTNSPTSMPSSSPSVSPSTNRTTTNAPVDTLPNSNSLGVIVGVACAGVAIVPGAGALFMHRQGFFRKETPQEVKGAEGTMDPALDL